VVTSRTPLILVSGSAAPLFADFGGHDRAEAPAGAAKGRAR